MSEAERSALKELVSEAVAEQLRAAAGLMTSEQIANYLGVSVRRWQEMYRGNAALWATRIELETRGEGAELRWDLAEVMRVLRRRKR